MQEGVRWLLGNRLLVADRAVSAIGAGWVPRAEMMVEILTYLGLALTRSAFIAAAPSGNRG